MFANESVRCGKTVTARAVQVILLVVAMSLLFATSPTHAQQTMTVGELSALNSANIIKAAQVTGAELDAKLNHGVSVASASVPNQSGTSSTPVDRAIVDDPAPVLKGVFGANGILVATFLYAGGGTANAKQGQSIPGGYTVSHLAAEQVTLRDKKGHAFEVPFSDLAPVRREAAAAAQQTPFNGIPMPMGMPPMAAPSLSVQP